MTHRQHATASRCFVAEDTSVSALVIQSSHVSVRNSGSDHEATPFEPEPAEPWQTWDGSLTAVSRQSQSQTAGLAKQP